MEPKTAQHMRWHKEGRRANPNVMVHPSDAKAWKQFNRLNLDFELDARNVRIAMATDGFNPFGYGKAQYSCWPVFVIPLNLPPALCMKEENIFLSLVIPGPEHPVDTRALYQCSCGRRRGKWAMFNGVIDDNEALPELRSSHANAAAVRRQRQEEEERLRKEVHDGRAAKEYAQSMFEWGAMVHAYYGNMQKFMEQVASHNRMPATAVPSPPAPPPLPPAYVAASSPNPSFVNVGTFGSPIRMETPKETLSRIAYGGYRCHVNATSGAAPEDDDEFPKL